MSNDSNEKHTRSSGFREQILRELDERKKERLGNDTFENPKEIEEFIPTSQEGEHFFSELTEDVEPDWEKAISTDEAEMTDTLVTEIPLQEVRTSETEDFTETIAVSKLSLDRAMQAYSNDDEDVLEETIISQKPSQKQDRRSRRAHRQTQEKAANRIVMVVVTIVLLTLGITGFTGYSYLKSCLDPIDATSTTNIQVEIPEGSSTQQIGQILVENNLIKNASVFNYYAKLKSYNNFQSGYYNLNQSMSLEELAKTLQESGSAQPQEPIAGKVLVIEGYTLEQISQAVTSNSYTDDESDTTPFTAEDFMKTVTNQEFISRMATTYPNLFASLPAADSGVKYQLEGYLFPATYEYTDSTTIEGLVEQMIATMDANLQPYYDQLASKGLTVNQLLTLASLVEKEGSTDEDRRNIASVFYNRLNIDMPLQSNIAILYALGKLGEKTTLAEDATIDTSIDSPYNIYVNTGLMPGPVDSPSLAAIEATFNPNKTNYYYFVADVKTGTVYYSETVEEHNQNVEKYVNSQLNN
ncbi:TPA: endolytic transglycosylase MltG [Streptococcus suis]